MLSMNDIMKISDRNYLVCSCRGLTSNVTFRRLAKILVTPYCLAGYMLTSLADALFPPKRHGLALVLIVRNEASYIREWLDFHAAQGVSHFIIYDNESTDNLREVLAPYESSGLVTYSTIKGTCRQVDAYNMALSKYGRSFRYIGFIDCDEFLFIRKNTHGGGGMIFRASLMNS